MANANINAKVEFVSYHYPMLIRMIILITTAKSIVLMDAQMENATQINA